MGAVPEVVRSYIVFPWMFMILVWSYLLKRKMQRIADLTQANQSYALTDPTHESYAYSTEEQIKGTTEIIKRQRQTKLQESGTYPRVGWLGIAKYVGECGVGLNSCGQYVFRSGPGMYGINSVNTEDIAIEFNLDDNVIASDFTDKEDNTDEDLVQTLIESSLPEYNYPDSYSGVGMGGSY